LEFSVSYVWDANDGLTRARAIAADAPRGRASITMILHARAERVELISDLDGWQREAHSFENVGDDTWRLELEAAPGTYAFALLVDGVSLTPLGADAYADDDFGGQNALLFVDADDVRVELTMPRP